VACGLMAARSAAAQPEPKPGDAAPPPVVPMENIATGQPAATEPPAAAGQPPATGQPPAAQPGPAGGGAPSGPPSGPSTGTSVGGAASSNDWKFDFHGYLRAPMRLGIGHRDAPLAGQKSTTVHNPLVPDDQYLSWQYTSVQSKDWSELFFSY